MNRPKWYTDEHDGAWQRVKAAFSNDWEQTKHDLGSKQARDLGQDVDDTVKQAAGAEDGFAKHENAFRFGYAAQRQYKAKHPTWNSALETDLRNDYGSEFERDRAFIRHAYEYRDASRTTTSSQRDDARPH